jgi:undecaprenyl-diphosphatase
MSDWLTAALLGLVQGLTEFLPVSSSGHLVVFQNWLHEEHTPIVFDLVLHLGTLLPILWVYRLEVWNLIQSLVKNPTGTESRLAWWIVLGSVPTAAIGIAFEDLFNEIFQTPSMVASAFFVTGSFLFATKYLSEGQRDETAMTWKDALVIGTIQGLAITPGISRSGSTIAIAMLLGLKRDLAARYSFLLSIPAIVGGFVLKLDELDFDVVSAGELASGFIVSAISGLVALKILLKLVNAGDFSKFSYYLWAIAVLGWFVL